MKLPRKNEDLPEFVRKHGLPKPNPGETSGNYRKRLTKIIEDNQMQGDV